MSANPNPSSYKSRISVLQKGEMSVDKFPSIKATLESPFKDGAVSLFDLGALELQQVYSSPVDAVNRCAGELVTRATDFLLDSCVEVTRRPEWICKASDPDPEAVFEHLPRSIDLILEFASAQLSEGLMVQPVRAYADSGVADFTKLIPVEKPGHPDLQRTHE